MQGLEHIPKAIPFKQARHYRPGPTNRGIRWIVIHSAEIGESLSGAEALMNSCAVQERVASWHYAVDADSITQSVREQDIAFQAPGCNKTSVGIELSGRARQSAQEWQDPYSLRMLELVAWLVSEIGYRHQVPLVFAPAAVLLANGPGITTHAEVSKAWKKSDHWDPGPKFPMEWLIERAGHYRRLVHDTEPAPALPSEGSND
jgi:N-acetyl-anhydromuramyl-L-alanine amidase AmpD